MSTPDQLGEPADPLPVGTTSQWTPTDAAYWRAYHLDDRTPSATFRRGYGPIARFDHHVCDPPAHDPAGRTVVYLASTLATALAEALRSREIGAVCPRWRIAPVKTEATVTLQDITHGGAMQIGALPALSTGAVDRLLSQRWARAIHATGRVDGILYSGAHDFGDAIVLRETARGIAVVVDDGVPQDFAIIDPPVWDRARFALRESVGIHLRRIPSNECQKCVQRGLA